MSKLITRAAASVIAVVLLLATAEANAQARAEDSARHATYACPLPANAEALQQRVTELYPQKHDKNALGCAADLLTAAAATQPTDVSLSLQALLVTAEYIEHVNTLWDFDLYGVRQPEWKARLEHALPSGNILAARVAEAAPADPTALCARAYYDVVWPARMADAKTALKAARGAKELLERATGKEPAVLDGNCLLMLGRLHYELPEFAGGDPERGFAELKRARDLAPRNRSILRYLAYVQLQQGDADAAKQTLTQMLTDEPERAERQLWADELRNGRDLATRMPDPQLAARLDARRQLLLKAHPELLTRAITAANMHGGVDPITGKEY